MSLSLGILNGEYDENLDDIYEAIKERRSQLKAQAAATLKFQLKKGSRVRFTDSVRPKYLAGVGATIEKVNQKKVLLKVDAGFGGAYMGKSLNTPLSLIELVEA